MAAPIGTITEIEVRVGSKVSFNYGSHELSVSVKTMVPPDADPVKVAEATEAWGNAFVGRGNKEWLDAQAKQQKDTETISGALKANTEAHQAATAAAVAAVPAPVQPTLPVDVNEPTRHPLDERGNEYDIITVQHFTVEMTKSGKRIGKAFGGRWMKYGVTFWPEVANEVGLDIDRCDLDRKYNLPTGWTKARVELEGDKPKKVVKFEA